MPNDSEKIPLTYEPKKTNRFSLFTWVLCAVVVVALMLGSFAYWYWQWPAPLAFDFVVLLLGVVGIPAGIYYGSQKKDYWM